MIHRGARIASAYRRACLAELCALKPGNVHIFAGGHRMGVEDLRISAVLSARFMADPGLGVGQRIALAQRASGRAAGCNTNLGILLLAAPIVQAAHRGRGGLGENLDRVLAELDADDTRWTFRAIRMAAPAGLGSSPRHDVFSQARAPLRLIMASARRRDRIAAQYAEGFADILEAERRVLRPALADHGDYCRGIRDTYLDFLRRFPDTHVGRKHGPRAARQLRDQARRITGEDAPPPSLDDLLAWDADLKKRGMNPGTSADFTVATLLVHFLSDIVGN